MGRRWHDEGGLSLIELLVAVVVLGIGAVGVLAAMTSSITGADVHRSLAAGEVVTRDYAEAIKAHAMTLDDSAYPCPTQAVLTPAFDADAFVEGYTAEVIAVDYWVLDTSGVMLGSYGDRTSCLAAHEARCGGLDAFVGCDTSAQRLTVRVTASAKTGAAATTQESRVVVRRGNP